MDGVDGVVKFMEQKVVSTDVFGASFECDLCLMNRRNGGCSREYRSDRSCNTPVDWVKAQMSRYSESTATQAVHAFNIPVSEAKRRYRAHPVPDDLVRLKAEYFERTNGDRFGCGRGGR
jgi:hypothetical protein